MQTASLRIVRHLVSLEVWLTAIMSANEIASAPKILRLLPITRAKDRTSVVNDGKQLAVMIFVACALLLAGVR